ncbi:hypothetical protein PMIN07_003231 [Paraphaeosphaeria minitans]
MRLFARDVEFRWPAISRWIRDDSVARMWQLVKLQNKLENQMFGNVELAHRVFDIAAQWDSDNAPSKIQDQTCFQRDIIWSSCFTSTIFLTIVWPLRNAVKLDVFIEIDIWREMYGAVWVAFAEAVYTHADWAQTADGHPAVDLEPVLRAVRQIPEKHYRVRPAFDHIPGQHLGYTCEDSREEWMEAHEKEKARKVVEGLEVEVAVRKTTGRFY